MPYISPISQKNIDCNNNGKNEIVIDHAYSILFYEYNGKNGFDLIDSIPLDTNYPYIVIEGIGDLDGDGLKDAVIWKTLSKRLWVYEQRDMTSFFDTVVWTSDTIFKALHYVSITNKLKGDGVDRIYGAGIPWLSTPSKALGWFYFTCICDNQYEILNTFEENTQIESAMDIGDIDNDSLTEVVLESYFKTQIFKYESVSSSDDSFEFTDSIMSYGSTMCLLILPDLDRDGRNEVEELLINHIDVMWYQVSYKCVIFEGTDIIFNREFVVGTDYPYLVGGDIDYGDIDGDGLNELVICGGRHIEVWESTGDNQFERMWEWTDPTYYTIESYIRCYDFNKNGIDEIIFSGGGESLGEECTRIFECDTTRDPSAPEIIRAEASDGVIVEAGFDYDDYIRKKEQEVENTRQILDS